MEQFETYYVVTGRRNLEAKLRWIAVRQAPRLKHDKGHLIILEVTEVGNSRPCCITSSIRTGHEFVAERATEEIDGCDIEASPELGCDILEHARKSGSVRRGCISLQA